MLWDVFGWFNSIVMCRVSISLLHIFLFGTIDDMLGDVINGIFLFMNFITFVLLQLVVAVPQGF